MFHQEVDAPPTFVAERLGLFGNNYKPKLGRNIPQFRVFVQSDTRMHSTTFVVVLTKSNSLFPQNLQAEFQFKSTVRIPINAFLFGTDAR